MKKKLTPNEVLYNVDFHEKNESLKLKDIPEIKTFYEKRWNNNRGGRI